VLVAKLADAEAEKARQENVVRAVTVERDEMRENLRVQREAIDREREQMRVNLKEQLDKLNEDRLAEQKQLAQMRKDDQAVIAKVQKDQQVLISSLSTQVKELSGMLKQLNSGEDGFRATLVNVEKQLKQKQLIPEGYGNKEIHQQLVELRGLLDAIKQEKVQATADKRRYFTEKAKMDKGKQEMPPKEAPKSVKKREKPDNLPKFVEEARHDGVQDIPVNDNLNKYWLVCDPSEVKDVSYTEIVTRQLWKLCATRVKFGTETQVFLNSHVENFMPGATDYLFVGPNSKQVVKREELSLVAGTPLKGVLRVDNSLLPTKMTAAGTAREPKVIDGQIRIVTNRRNGLTTSVSQKTLIDDDMIIHTCNTEAGDLDDF